MAMEEIAWPWKGGVAWPWKGEHHMGSTWQGGSSMAMEEVAWPWKNSMAMEGGCSMAMEGGVAWPWKGE